MQFNYYKYVGNIQSYESSTRYFALSNAKQK